jgi:catechol 2,3-dioxygenase-like lactoylglutathione lyase family enzyme
MNHVHHVHLFASDIEKSLAFYQNAFGGKIILDEELAGARNVFMRVGTGRIHFYDQAPSFSGRGSIHHFGIQTDDIDGVVEKLKAMGVPFKKASRTSASGNMSWCPRPTMCSLNCSR